ncbi:hypothetical protein RhiLY_05116 [Ceratobasidium sp. AG-Ba]|nr:hypothetical protein RhiLY_05116 [Ceratobasidium sp. AG-Ba]
MSFACRSSDVTDMCYAVGSNPDISGIGVRIALYAQTILSLLASSYMPDNNLAFRDSARTTYITSFALIASSIAQWKHGGLSLFDGIISTMLTSLMTVFVTTNYRYIQELGASIQIASFLFTTFWCYWGIQVWSRSTSFGLEAPDNGLITDCTANVDTIFVVFGASISAANNGIRIFALLVFSAVGGFHSIQAGWCVIKNLWHYWQHGGANTKEYNIEATVMREEYGDGRSPYISSLVYISNLIHRGRIRPRSEWRRNYSRGAVRRLGRLCLSRLLDHHDRTHHRSELKRAR